MVLGGEKEVESSESGELRVSDEEIDPDPLCSILPEIDWPNSSSDQVMRKVDEIKDYLIFELGLIDLLMVGRDFTWSNGRAWSKLDRFLVSASWEVRFPDLRQKSFVLAGKLKVLKADLKKWNVEEFVNTKNKRKLLMQYLQSLEERELLGDISGEELERKKVIVDELEKIILMEEISWRQKSRVLWLKEDQEVIKDRIVNFYEKLFSEEYSWRPKLDGMFFDSIDEASADWLERAFEEDEVLDVVRGMARDKGSGPDGFSMAFFQSCWDIVRDNIMKVEAVEMWDFQPVSLVNGGIQDNL
ncbi:uncharacterized protein LOC108989210 [Juglans regia]|uniref:Uncharacterized protein LOC108989210 n=1 Tax=Juglans regia TaxID=51240 RepID=A0A6P9EWY2_JUGRE|nr:uncharacterized protein LOC108989210 [Juglans regia]